MAFTFQFQPNKENTRDRVDGPTVEIPDQIQCVICPVLDATNTILRHEEELRKLEQQMTKRHRVTSGRC